MYIKEFDQRSHKEGGNDGSDPHHFGHLLPAVPCQQTEAGSQHHHRQVADDPAEPERYLLLFFRDDQRNRVIGGYAQIRCKIKRRRQTHDHHCDQQQHQTSGQGHFRQDLLQQLLTELRHKSQQEQIDQCREPYLPSVKNEREGKQKDIGDHIQYSEADGKDRIQPAHQRLERIHSQSRMLEHSHTDTADEDSDHAHPDPAHKNRVMQIDERFLFHEIFFFDQFI